jgi:hypothetical protein
MAAATASSKKLEAPMRAEGQVQADVLQVVCAGAADADHIGIAVEKRAIIGKFARRTQIRLYGRYHSVMGCERLGRG